MTRVVRVELELRNWLAGNGFPDLVELAPLQVGLGSTAMWSFRPAPDALRLAVRIYGAGAAAAADREAAAMRAATRAGVPAPEVHATGTIGDHPLLVTAFMPGVTVRDALMADPARAHDLGVAMGETLGRIHQLSAPEVLRDGVRSWLDLGEQALAPIRDRLKRVPGQNRLAHLDYHPLNVLTENGTVTAVIDWENTRAAPPHMDLARSRAILRAAQIGGALPEAAAALFDAFAQGLVAGHTDVIGPDPHPALSTAWGLAMTTADLAAQAGKPGSPITTTAVDQIAALRDAAIAEAREDR
jgi:aminoglycoside phosphotransferase (APT) family kinase protein